MSEEKELVLRAQKGDHTAQAALFQQHYSFLAKYLLKITMHRQLAEDLAQETMLKALEKIKFYNFSSKFSTWLITIASRLYIDALRRNKRESKVLRQAQAPRTMLWQTAKHSDAGTEALEELSKLSADIRVPILLKHYYGYSYEEIAEMLNIPLGTVKSRIHNGLKNLRKEFNNDEF